MGSWSSATFSATGGDAGARDLEDAPRTTFEGSAHTVVLALQLQVDGPHRSKVRDHVGPLELLLGGRELRPEEG